LKILKKKINQHWKRMEHKLLTMESNRHNHGSINTMWLINNRSQNRKNKWVCDSITEPKQQGEASVKSTDHSPITRTKKNYEIVARRYCERWTKLQQIRLTSQAQKKQHWFSLCFQLHQNRMGTLSTIRCQYLRFGLGSNNH